MKVSEKLTGKRGLILGTCLLVFALLLFSCQTVPVTGRHQFLMISGAEEVRLGEAAYRKILAESKLSGDTAGVERLRKVGSRIAAAAGREDYQWEFNLIEDETPNAFALPGGKVAFYTGILKFTQDETGLAVVMGHEVAHALAHHGAERMSTTILTQIGAAAAQALGRGDPQVTEKINGAFGIGGQLGILLPFSRKHESEADQIGLILMARAGYDPREAAAFWRRMSGASGGQAPPEFLSTHPSDERRIRQIEAWLPDVLPLYRQAKGSPPGGGP